ncbi:uncharacterized protein BJ171DRAFT_241155 [Polychytrium aggregatum]|uniref:uncharacterized protein n=1 Tax=Polychytrium aggregatum TaxID=110093 RepID=UPI0022FE0385|nr:uncharacterized protein BJ171DRAFT_241155 [Polychytrium aggregatum]KAI9197156.1 hypothetical protein BJ171DRAFT_241155 [Polychytrium aggregatum]
MLAITSTRTTPECSCLSQPQGLREAAAVGNLRAVQSYLHAGVNVNSQHAMNKWSPLHWASQRGHAEVVRYLIAHGADREVRNSKDQTALDLAKSSEVQIALGVGESRDVDSTPKGDSTDEKFVPNYLRNPELAKLWSTPEELTDYSKLFSRSSNESTQAEPSNAPQQQQQQQQQHRDQAQPNSHPELLAAPSASPLLASGPQNVPQELGELLVYHREANGNASANLLGAIFYPPSRTIEQALEQIQHELDWLDGSTVSVEALSEANQGLKLFRRTQSGIDIPIGRKQYRQLLSLHFRNSGDQLVIQTAVQSK